MDCESVPLAVATIHIEAECAVGPTKGACKGDEAAQQAERDAAKMHQGMAPSDAPEYALDTETSIVDLLSDAGLVNSKSEARRLVQQGGVRLDGEQVLDIMHVVMPQDREQVVQAGKRKFLRIHPGT